MSYLAKGSYTQQAHVKVPEGLFEEEHGREGFFGPVSQLYHSHPPTDWTRIEGPLKPRAYDTTKLAAKSPKTVFDERVCFLENADVRLSVWRPSVSLQNKTAFYRNADGDEVVFVHRGYGTCHTEYGPLPYQQGDYIILPRGTTAQFEALSTPEETFFLVIQSATRIEQPSRGMLGRHALYDQTALVTPEPCDYSLNADKTKTEYAVTVLRESEQTTFYYAHHPLDVAGWKGDLYPFKLNVHDICPVMSHRAHLPPSVHTTFVARNFVICSFVPRPLESAERAERVPFYHRNIDFDEVLFYHDGDFFSRDNIKPGMVSFHPQGFHHGPHATAKASSWDKTFTDEIAVMIDTRYPLKPTPEAESVEWQDYWKSWQVSQAKLDNTKAE
jgi:homogentisate 1,2-dioxygenase